MAVRRRDPPCGVSELVMLRASDEEASMVRTMRGEAGEPSEVGVAEVEPEPMQLEGARLLANEARSQLHGQGFDDEQIRKWANTYVARHGNADPDDFVRWVAERGQRPTPRRAAEAE